MGMELVMRTATFGEVGKQLEAELQAEEGATVEDVCMLVVEFLEDRDGEEMVVAVADDDDDDEEEEEEEEASMRQEGRGR
eukprot:489746-Hanusia_phi.AAC.3